MTQPLTCAQCARPITNVSFANALQGRVVCRDCYGLHAYRKQWAAQARGSDWEEGVEDRRARQAGGPL